MPKPPQPKKPAYTPTTPVVDTLFNNAQRPLFGVSTSPGGLGAPASTQKKTLIGGAS